MPRYISLIQFTEKGTQAAKKSTERAGSFRQLAEKGGVKVEAQYWTVGPYDGVLILSAPKAEQALHVLTELVAGGYVKTQTMQAFTAEEFGAIVGGS